MLTPRRDLQAALIRLGGRRVGPAGVALLVIFFVALASLSLTWVGAGMLAVLVWALLWPDGERFATALVGTESQPPASGSSRSVAAVIGPSMLGQLLAGVPDPALVLDGRSFVMAYNPAAAALSPVIAGRHISLLSRAPELLTAVERARTTGEVQAFEMRTTVPVKRLLSGLATPLTREDGAGGAPLLRPAMMLVLRDQTAEQQLIQLRADFVANASHELRTPLASLKGFVETLQGPAKDDAVARSKFLAIMQTQADVMARLIDDLLSLSRIEMREHVPPSDAVDITAVVELALTSLRHLADAHHQTLALSVPTGAVGVIGDHDELQQIMQNLIQNAIKYGKRGGRVDIAIKADGRQVSISVRDDGIGIAAEHLPRLTERFYRVSAKDSRERGGTGLGLAIVKHIVNRHRGELRIMSRMGEGSTFEILLPQHVANAGTL